MDFLEVALKKNELDYEIHLKQEFKKRYEKIGKKFLTPNLNLSWIKY
jgi:hypothetical protein